MAIDFNTREPLYLQVIRHFKTQIATGVLEPGEEVPSRREIANTFKINPNTAQRAFKEMEEAGLIRTEGNSPSKITNDDSVIKEVREELVMTAVEEFVEVIKPVNVPLEELLELVEQTYAPPQDKEEGKTND